MSPELDVSQGGTHVGIILFSSADRTNVELKLGQVKNASEIAGHLDNLRYSEINGNHTRTELALDMSKMVRKHLSSFSTELSPSLIFNNVQKDLKKEMIYVYFKKN